MRRHPRSLGRPRVATFAAALSGAAVVLVLATLPALPAGASATAKPGGVTWTPSGPPAWVANPAGPTPRSAVVRAAALGDTSDCYHSVWADPQDDAAQIDVVSDGAFYDCGAGRWSFGIATADSWATSSLAVYNIYIDADSNPATGCGGFEWLAQANYSGGALHAQLLHVSGCGASNATSVGAIDAYRNATGELYLALDNSMLGSPTDIRW